MKSIRRQLAVTLCAAAAVLLPAGGLAVYFTARKVLISQFDATLAAKAQALITASEIEHGRFEIDFDVQSFAGFGEETGGDYFEVWHADGRVLERSPLLRETNLPWAAVSTGGEPRFGATALPGGVRGRFISQRFAPAKDKKHRFGNLQLTVASDSTVLWRTLRALTGVLMAAETVGLATALLLLQLALRRGLRPLDELAARVQGIRVGAAGQRLETARLPAELRGVGEKLNDLLDRVHSSLARERRFSSHAAHELRTPLAELKVMAELAAAWPDEATPQRLSEMVSVIGKVENLLAKLSLLSRAEAGAHAVCPEAVDLAGTVRSAVDRFLPAARRRGIGIHPRIEPDPFTCDPVLWQTILNNLLDNAVSYAPAGDRVEVEASPGRLSVSNAAPDLADGDTEFLFERFWRKNTAHAGKRHSGLGLSIVASCCELLGAACRADLSPEKKLRVEIAWPPSAQNDSRKPASAVTPS